MVLLDLGPGPATPSWLPLLMVVVLLALIGFLYWSMRRNLNRIDFEEKPTGAPAATTPDSPASPLE
jgi:protein-S-isoprenylcysteine O-methyltransferase Ste14